MTQLLINENSWHDDVSIVETATRGVYFSKRDKVYWFRDEAEQLDGPYYTEREATVALEVYVDHL